MLLFSCSRQKYQMDDFVGVYYYKYLHKRHGILNYLILKRDSTYALVYTDASGKFINTGKWDYKEPKDWKPRLCFSDWKMFGKAKDVYDLRARDVILYYDTPYCIEFNPDTDVDFWRVDSVEAARLGIKEENVIWAVTQ